MTLPNLLSLIRLAGGLLLIVIAWFGKEQLFLVVLILCFFLDLIDGPIARWLHQISELGPRLDSIADFSVYSAFLIGAWWLWPDIIVRERVYILLLVASLLIPVVFGLFKFHKTTSYHTWLVKLAAVCIAPGAIILFLSGPAWLFHMATVISVLAAIEQIIITCLLDHTRSNIRSIFHVIRTLKTQ